MSLARPQLNPKFGCFNVGTGGMKPYSAKQQAEMFAVGNWRDTMAFRAGAFHVTSLFLVFLSLYIGFYKVAQKELQLRL